MYDEAFKMNSREEVQLENANFSNNFDLLEHLIEL